MSAPGRTVGWESIAAARTESLAVRGFGGESRGAEEGQSYMGTQSLLGQGVSVSLTRTTQVRFVQISTSDRRTTPVTSHTPVTPKKRVPSDAPYAAHSSLKPVRPWASAETGVCHA